MKKLYARTALALLLALVALTLTSWLLAATSTAGVRSMLSSEGVRHFFGHFTAMVGQPPLVWLLLLAMAWGSCVGSGLSTCLRRPPVYRQGLALRVTAAVLLMAVAVVLLLTAVPHAVLLSATGRLWPSPFSRALVPIVAAVVIVMSAVYGAVTRRIQKPTELFDTLAGGISAAAPLIVIYVLAAQLYHSARFVFGG